MRCFDLWPIRFFSCKSPWTDMPVMQREVAHVIEKDIIAVAIEFEASFKVGHYFGQHRSYIKSIRNFLRNDHLAPGDLPGHQSPKHFQDQGETCNKNNCKSKVSYQPVQAWRKSEHLNHYEPSRTQYVSHSTLQYFLCLFIQTCTISDWQVCPSTTQQPPGIERHSWCHRRRSMIRRI